MCLLFSLSFWWFERGFVTGFVFLCGRYMERDPVRGKDSFAAFEEMLLLAKQKQVGPVWCGVEWRGVPLRCHNSAHSVSIVVRVLHVRALLERVSF